MVLTGQIGIRPKLKMIKFVGGGGFWCLARLWALGGGLFSKVGGG